VGWKSDLIYLRVSDRRRRRSAYRPPESENRETCTVFFSIQFALLSDHSSSQLSTPLANGTKFRAIKKRKINTGSSFHFLFANERRDNLIIAHVSLRFLPEFMTFSFPPQTQDGFLIFMDAGPKNSYEFVFTFNLRGLGLFLIIFFSFVSSKNWDFINFIVSFF